jgi:O-antigen/teichoic acid export membrane protein
LDIGEEIAKSSVKGSFYLFVGGTLSTLITAITSILIGRLLGPDGYGLYSLSITPASLLIIATGFGINFGLVKYVSEFDRRGDASVVRRIVYVGLSFQVFVSIILSIFLYVFSDFFSIYLINRPDASFLIQISSIYILGFALFGSISQVFVGLGRMENSSIIAMVQSITKFIVCISLILLGYRVAGAVFGHSVSYLVGALVGGVILYILFRRYVSGVDVFDGGFDSRISTIYRLVSFGFPVYVGSVIITLLGVFRNYLLAIFMSNIDIGNFSAAVNLSAAIAIFVNPIAITLFQAFSRLDKDREIGVIRDLFRYAVKYSTLVILPITLFLIIMSRDVIFVLYGGSFIDAPLYLILASLPYVFIGLGYVIIGSFLNGLGDTRIVFRMSIIIFILSLPLYPLFILFWGILGLLVAIFIASISALFYGLYYSMRRYDVSVDYRSILRIYFSTVLSAATIFFVRSIYVFPRSIYNIIVYGLVYLLIYLVLLPITDSINLRDLDMLESSFREVKFVGWIIGLLILFERILYTRIKG